MKATIEHDGRLFDVRATYVRGSPGDDYEPPSAGSWEILYVVDEHGQPADLDCEIVEAALDAAMAERLAEELEWRSR